MKVNVYDIADQRPHLMVVASDGVHVIPHALVESVIAGDKASLILSEPVVKRIIEEWLQKLTE
jgi:predicted transcriptional regulator